MDSKESGVDHTKSHIINTCKGKTSIDPHFGASVFV